MGTAGALAASDDTQAGWALAGSPPGPQRHPVPGAQCGGCPGAGPARPVRALETVYKRFARWQTHGTGGRIEAALRVQAEGVGELDWDAQIDSGVVRAHPHAAGARKGGSHRSRQTASKRWGGSRGGLTTKLHTICDGRGRNLATRLIPGQDADTLQLVELVDAMRVARPGGRGRPAPGWPI